MKHKELVKLGGTLKEKCLYITVTSFFWGILGTGFGSLESEKIAIGSLES